MHEKILIQAEDGLTSATFVPALGGLGVSMTMPEPKMPGGFRELLYLPEDFSWETPGKISGGFPICFPICGRLSRDGEAGIYLFDGKRYQMGIHGFAHLFPWELLYHEKNRMGMRLSSNEKTLEMYPFSFELELHYEARPGEIVCRHQYINTSEDRVLCYYAGFHPYFYIDPSRYSKDKVIVCAEVSGTFFYNKTLSDIVDSDQTPLSLRSALSNPEINEKLFYLENEGGFELHFPDGAIIGVDFDSFEGEDRPSFPFLQLYHVPEKPFFCVEPWMSHPNAMNTQLATRVLFPGEVDEATLTLTQRSW